MKDHHALRRSRSEAGVALIIAIFVLMLVSIVAISLLISSGTETALGSNYRSSANAYYAALAGLEEGRGRLLPKNPAYFNNTVANFIPAAGLAVGDVRYILNPAGGETVAPWDLSTSTTYPDNEYQTEFSTPPPNAPPTINSVSGNNAQNIPGPLYKWVRINAVTERTLNLDVNSDGTKDSTTPLFFDGAHLNLSLTGKQALEITALAALPNGSQKLVQYIVTPVMLNLSFPAALTLDGNSVVFGPGTAQFQVNGNDQSVGACPAGPAVTAIGYTGTDASHIAATPPGNYTGPGGGPTTPSVNPVTLSPSLQDLNGLNALVQTITQSADTTISGPADRSSMPAAMSAANPLTIVVNGDLDLAMWHNTGYGILLVTGNLNYDPDASWEGIVLVIGKGTITTNYNGTGKFDGAVLAAKTVDSSGNPLVPPAPLGPASFTFSSGSGGNGIHYSNCWIKAVQTTPSTYKVLSFHEIPQP